MLGRLRAFLQSLTTGEAGFMNVVVGSTAFTFALYAGRAEMASVDLGVATSFKRTVPAFQRCKNQPDSSSSRRARSGAGTATTENWSRTTRSARPIVSRRTTRSCGTGSSGRGPRNC